MVTINKHMNDWVTLIKGEDEHGSAEMLFVSREQRVGVKINDEVRWFNVRGTEKNRIYLTKTGVTCIGGASCVRDYASQGENEFMWLARGLFDHVKPTKRKMFIEQTRKVYPELAEWV